MASPIRPPPPELAGEAQSPPPPPEHPAVGPSPLLPENPTTAPPLTPTSAFPSSSPPNRCSGDSSRPLPSQTPAPPPTPTTDLSPPLPRENQTLAPRPPPAPAPTPPPPPAPTPPPPPAPEGKSEWEEEDATGESENMTLALALTQTEEVIPPTAQKAAAAAESPAGSPQKESALTIAKLLSGEDPAATEEKQATDKVAPAVVTGSVAAAGGGGGGVGSMRWLLGGVPEKVRRAELRRAELGFRVSAAVFCLVSLSVMAADTTPGWSGDSFSRYNEYRYTLAASVMAFTYSGFQLAAEVHYLVTERCVIQGPWGNYFNLAMDQMLAYLLLSAASAALSRNDVWVSRFGVDQFAKLINASASMAFLAFIALGLNSIISAYYVFSSVS